MMKSHKAKWEKCLPNQDDKNLDDIRLSSFQFRQNMVESRNQRLDMVLISALFKGKI